MIELFVTTIEGFVVKKENLFFVDFDFVKENDQLDAEDDSIVESCIYCDEKGHGKASCWAKKVDKSDESDQDSIHS